MCNAQSYLQDCNDNVHSHNRWPLPLPSIYSYPLPPTGPLFDLWIALTAPLGTYQQPTDPVWLYTDEDIFGASTDRPHE